MIRNQAEPGWPFSSDASRAHTLSIGAQEIHFATPPDVRRAETPPAAVAMVRHMLRDLPEQAFWQKDRLTRIGEVRAGQTLIHDLRHGADFVFDRPYHAVHVIIPWAVLDDIAERANAARIRVLEATPCEALADTTIEHLVRAMLPQLREAIYPTQLYADHLKLALATHVAHTYGGMRPGDRIAKGGLAPHLLRRAQEVLRANLREGLSLEAIADECGLSARHFARAFRDSLGLSPHRWMMNERVAAAKALIQAGNDSLAEIAQTCGFADQSHLTRVFKREEGISPAAWRRHRQQPRLRRSEDHPHDRDSAP
jgi:AraC-like DNA-binding protein